MDSEGLAVFKGLINSENNLSSIDLSNTQLDSKGLKILAGVVNFTAIRELNLANNELTRDLDYDEPHMTVIDRSGFNTFFDVLKGNQALSKLDLSNNDLRSDGLITLSKALKSSSIKQLNIAHNRLTDTDHRNMSSESYSGVIQFTEDMKDMGSLVSLNLAKNELGVEGAKHVAEVLPKW